MRVTTGLKLSPQGSSPQAPLDQPVLGNESTVPKEEVNERPSSITISSVACPQEPPVFHASAPQPLVMASLVPQQPLFHP